MPKPNSLCRMIKGLAAILCAALSICHSWGSQAQAGLEHRSNRGHHGGCKEQATVCWQIQRKVGPLIAVAIWEIVVLRDTHHQHIQRSFRLFQPRSRHAHGRVVPAPGGIPIPSRKHVAESESHCFRVDKRSSRNESQRIMWWMVIASLQGSGAHCAVI